MFPKVLFGKKYPINELKVLIGKQVGSEDYCVEKGDFTNCCLNQFTFNFWVIFA